MLRLTAQMEERIDPRTVDVRLTHHLTSGWIANQTWRIQVFNGFGQTIEGDAQVIVQGLRSSPGCAAVIRLGSVVEVVLCRGMVDALERLGFARADIEVG